MSWGSPMRSSLREKIILVCDKKILTKGDSVGISFYAFFANKNDDPELLMEAATWWIKTHRLDHFEKAIKIKKMIAMLKAEKIAKDNELNAQKKLALAEKEKTLRLLQILQHHVITRFEGDIEYNYTFNGKIKKLFFDLLDQFPCRGNNHCLNMII